MDSLTFALITLLCGAMLSSTCVNTKEDKKIPFRDLFRVPLYFTSKHNPQFRRGPVPIYEHIRYIVASEQQAIAKETGVSLLENFTKKLEGSQYADMWNRSSLSKGSSSDIDCLSSLYDDTHADSLDQELAAYEHFFKCQSSRLPRVSEFNKLIYNNIIDEVQRAPKKGDHRSVEWYKRIIFEFPNILNRLQREFIKNNPTASAEMSQIPEIQRKGNLSLCKKVFRKTSKTWVNLDPRDLDCVAELYSQTYLTRFASFETGWPTIENRYKRFLECQNPRIPQNHQLLDAISKHLLSGLNISDTVINDKKPKWWKSKLFVTQAPKDSEKRQHEKEIRSSINALLSQYQEALRKSESRR